jgi:hypothetical protein
VSDTLYFAKMARSLNPTNRSSELPVVRNSDRN